MWCLETIVRMNQQSQESWLRSHLKETPDAPQKDEKKQKNQNCTTHGRAVK